MVMTSGETHKEIPNSSLASDTTSSHLSVPFPATSTFFSFHTLARFSPLPSQCSHFLQSALPTFPSSAQHLAYPHIPFLCPPICHLPHCFADLSIPLITARTDFLPITPPFWLHADLPLIWQTSNLPASLPGCCQCLPWWLPLHYHLK